MIHFAPAATVKLIQPFTYLETVLVWPAMAALLGVFAWGQSDLPHGFNGFAVLLPVIWAQAPNRWCAGAVVALYTLLASRGLVVGVPTFFDSHALSGVGLWLLAGSLPLAPGLLCWSSSFKRRIWRIPWLLGLWIIPPVALVGWAHPLTAAGWLFPGWGWWGLLATVLLMMGLAYEWKRPPPIRRLAVLQVLIVLIVFAQWSTDEHSSPENWIGHHTHYPFDDASNKARDLIAEWQRHQDLQQVVSQHPGKTVQVFPETVGGVWNRPLTQDWQRTLQHTEIQVLMGAYQRLPNTRQYLSGLMHVTPNGAQLLYQQRMPIPAGMWKPWSRDGAVLGGLINPVVTVQDKTVAVFICYESLLVWPVLHSLLYQPDVLVSIASTWWAPSSINQSQQQAMRGWSRLWAVPLVEAFNQ